MVYKYTVLSLNLVSTLVNNMLNWKTNMESDGAHMSEISKVCRVVVWFNNRFTISNE